jgi:hypothetical protein
MTLPAALYPHIIMFGIMSVGFSMLALCGIDSGPVHFQAVTCPERGSHPHGSGVRCRGCQAALGEARFRWQQTMLRCVSVLSIGGWAIVLLLVRP